MDTEALTMGAPELSRTSTTAPVSSPAGTNPGGTAPPGKLIRVAKIWGGGAEGLPSPPPPPLQAASSRQAAAALARAPSLLWDRISSLPGRSRPPDNTQEKRARTADCSSHGIVAAYGALTECR